MLVRVLVQRRRMVGMELTRRIVLKPDHISIADTITNS